MKASDYIINFLVSRKVRYVFEVCGGSIAHILDSAYKRKGVKLISMHHEQAAAFAAEGYSRVSQHGGIGVAIATSGPGATNLITGIGSCFFDSVPCIFITGQVNTYEFKFNRPVRQMGFQETDIINIVKPITKESILIENSQKIKYYLQKAFYIAKSNRPGPVLLDIPMNIQKADIEPQSIPAYRQNFPANKIHSFSMRRITRLLKQAHRPIVLLGGGMKTQKARDIFAEFIRKTEIPVVSSLMGLDTFGYHPSFVGMIGIYGNRFANLAVSNADLILALGTRLDSRQTGTNVKAFAKNARIIHVDIDKFELKYKKIRRSISICADLEQFLSILNQHISGFDKIKIGQWKKYIDFLKARYLSHELPASQSIKPNFFIYKLSEHIPKEAIICADVGQSQMWTVQSIRLSKKQRLLTQGGMGAMGSGLPMAIGACFAAPGKTVVVITGDGGFQLNIQELETVFHHQLPIKIIVINNHCYGMVRQFQKQYFQSKFQSTVIGYSCPELVSVSCAYKIPALKIKHNSQIVNALEKLFRDKKPYLLEVEIDQENLVLPKLAVNKSLAEQDPALPGSELKNIMFTEFIKRHN